MASDHRPVNLSLRTLTILVKLIVWVGLFVVLYLLRSFSLLLFLTFVFAYIQAKAVDRLELKIKRRALRVSVVGVVFLTLIVGIISFLAPYVRDQAKSLTKVFPQVLKELDSQVFEVTQNSPLAAELLPSFAALSQEVDGWDIKKSPSAQIIEGLLGVAAEDGVGLSTREVIDRLRTITERGLAVGSSFLLSLLFSFLIVLDLPALRASVQRLKFSRLQFVYDEVAHTIADFARVLGSALEAQLYIALLNTVLTAIGINILGIGSSTAFLSVIVFFCSFIPVAGVFLSSVPICLLALQKGGLALMVGAALLIWIIHMIEAYILNPRIYGHALRINPVLVLIILTVAGKVFGVWGLVLGLPVCTYLFGHAIWYRDGKPLRNQGEAEPTVKGEI